MLSKTKFKTMPKSSRLNALHVDLFWRESGTLKAHKNNVKLVPKSSTENMENEIQQKYTQGHRHTLPRGPGEE